MTIRSSRIADLYNVRDKAFLSKQSLKPNGQPLKSAWKKYEPAGRAPTKKSVSFREDREQKFTIDEVVIIDSIPEGSPADISGCMPHVSSRALLGKRDDGSLFQRRFQGLYREPQWTGIYGLDGQYDRKHEFSGRTMTGSRAKSIRRTGCLFCLQMRNEAPWLPFDELDFDVPLGEDGTSEYHADYWDSLRSYCDSFICGECEEYWVMEDEVF